MNDDENLMQEVRKLGVQAAPQHLEEKLLSIPERYEQEAWWQRYKNIAAVGVAAAVLVLSFTHWPKPDQLPDTEISEQRVLEAQKEVALAFHYFNSVSLQASEKVNQHIAHSSQQAIYKGVFYPLIEENESNTQ